MSATCKLLQYDNDPIDRLRLLKLSITLTLLPCLQGHSLIVECPQSCTRYTSLALHLTRIDNLENNLFLIKSYSNKFVEAER